MMPPFPDPTSPDEMPEPTPALVVSRVIVEAWLGAVSRKQAVRFLKNLGRVIETREEMAHVIPLRKGARSKSDQRAEREALAALRQYIALWLARLPPE